MIKKIQSNSTRLFYEKLEMLSWYCDAYPIPSKPSNTICVCVLHMFTLGTLLVTLMMMPHWPGNIDYFRPLPNSFIPTRYYNTYLGWLAVHTCSINLSIQVNSCIMIFKIPHKCLINKCMEEREEDTKEKYFDAITFQNCGCFEI